MTIIAVTYENGMGVEFFGPFKNQTDAERYEDILFTEQKDSGEHILEMTFIDVTEVREWMLV